MYTIQKVTTGEYYYGFATGCCAFGNNLDNAYVTDIARANKLIEVFKSNFDFKQNYIITEFTGH